LHHFDLSTRDSATGGLCIERDRYFRPTITLQGYADAAHRDQHISA
jgi:hypothetical protein